MYTTSCFISGHGCTLRSATQHHAVLRPTVLKEQMQAVELLLDALSNRQTHGRPDGSM